MKGGDEVEYDYSNYYHVDYLLQHLYNRDITDWKGLGLILWDVHEILMTQIQLTARERQLMKHLAAGYELNEVAFEMRECYNGIIQKFINHHSEVPGDMRGGGSDEEESE